MKRSRFKEEEVIGSPPILPLRFRFSAACPRAMPKTRHILPSVKVAGVLFELAPRSSSQSRMFRRRS